MGVVLSTEALREEPALSQPWGQAWPYLACSREVLVPSASLQVLLCLVASERTSDLKQTPLLCLTRWQRDA